MSYLLTTIGPLTEWVLRPSRLQGTPTKIFIEYMWVDYKLYWSIILVGSPILKVLRFIG